MVPAQQHAKTIENQHTDDRYPMIFARLAIDNHLVSSIPNLDRQQLGARQEDAMRSLLCGIRQANQLIPIQANHLIR